MSSLKKVSNNFRKQNYKPLNSSPSSELYSLSNLMESSWELIWTLDLFGLKEKDFTISVQFSHSC